MNSASARLLLVLGVCLLSCVTKKSDSEAKSPPPPVQREALMHQSNNSFELFFSLGVDRTKPLTPTVWAQEQSYDFEVQFPDSGFADTLILTTPEHKIQLGRSYYLKHMFDFGSDAAFSPTSIAFRFSDSCQSKEIDLSMGQIAFFLNDSKFNCRPLLPEDWERIVQGTLCIDTAKTDCIEETSFVKMRGFYQTSVEELRATYEENAGIIHPINGAVFATSMMLSPVVGLSLQSAWSTLYGYMLGRATKQEQKYLSGAKTAAIILTSFGYYSVALPFISVASALAIYRYTPVGDYWDQGIYGPYLEGPDPEYSDLEFLDPSRISSPYLRCLYFKDTPSPDKAPNAAVWVKKAYLPEKLQKIGVFYKDYMVAPGRWLKRDFSGKRAVAFGAILDPYSLSTACLSALVDEGVINHLKFVEPELERIVPAVSYSAHFHNNYPIFFYAKGPGDTKVHLLADEKLAGSLGKSFAVVDKWASDLVYDVAELAMLGVISKGAAVGVSFLNERRREIMAVTRQVGRIFGEFGVQYSSHGALSNEEYKRLLRPEETANLLHQALLPILGSSVLVAALAVTYYGAGSLLVGQEAADGIPYQSFFSRKDFPLGSHKYRIYCQYLYADHQMPFKPTALQQHLSGFWLHHPKEGQNLRSFAVTGNPLLILQQCFKAKPSSPFHELEQIKIIIGSETENFGIPVNFFVPISFEDDYGNKLSGYQAVSTLNWQYLLAKATEEDPYAAGDIDYRPKLFNPQVSPVRW